MFQSLHDPAPPSVGSADLAAVQRRARQIVRRRRTGVIGGVLAAGVFALAVWPVSDNATETAATGSTVGRTTASTEAVPAGLDLPILEGTLPTVEARVKATVAFELFGTAEPGKLGARMAISSNQGSAGISTEPSNFDGLMIGGATAALNDPTLAFWFGVTADEVARIDVTVGCSELATTHTVATPEIPGVRFFAVAAPASATRTAAEVEAGLPTHREPTVRGYGTDGTLLVESRPQYSGDECHRPVTPRSAVRTSVTLALGHCYIEPVTIGEYRWVQRMGPGDLGIGNGGSVPSRFTGKGTLIIVSDTEARYEDETGLEVPFVLDDGTLPPRECR